MAVVRLASIEDVEEMIGRDLTAEEEIRAGAILDKASELFRKRSGQQFTPGGSEVRLRVTANYVTLPQRPVVSVESVARDCENGSAVNYSRFKSQLTVEGIRAGEFVRVSYTHGDAEVPDVVRLCIADIARQVLGISKLAIEGTTQHSETTGPYTESTTYATWAVGGSTRLSPDDNALADSYRRKIPGSILLQAGQ